MISNFNTQNIYNKNEVLNTNLKERKLQEAKIKLTALEEKLKLLEISDIPNKDEMIINCKHDIEKQKRIISHTTSYLE
ncbi:hypothetical protein KSU90_12415 [Erysipelatoclostridium sp. MSK.23.68]|nr:hypothetical protein [Erysipelatoclostridium sp. MSK.23.68]